MENSGFAERLRQAIIAAMRTFHEEHKDETPYAFAIVLGQVGGYLGFAIPTEEGLQKVAAEYKRMGYHYQPFEWEVDDQLDRLATWLRWANPDDGWNYGDFAERFHVAEHLKALVDSGAFGEDAADLEEFCTDVLASLQTDDDWQKLQANSPVIVGLTYGDDPSVFLRTATRSNPYHMVLRLWDEHWQSEEMSRGVKAPKK